MEHFLVEKNSGTDRVLITREMVIGYFSVDNPNRCVILDYDIYELNEFNANEELRSPLQSQNTYVEGKITQNDDLYYLLNLGQRDSNEGTITIDTTVDPTYGEFEQFDYYFRIQARADFTRYNYRGPRSFKDIHVTIRICGLETV